MQKLFGSNQKRTRQPVNPGEEEKTFQEYVFYALQKAKELDKYIQLTRVDFKDDIESCMGKSLNAGFVELQKYKSVIGECYASIRTLKEQIEVYDRVYGDTRNFTNLSTETKDLIAELKQSREKVFAVDAEHESLIDRLKQQLRADDRNQQCFEINKKLVDENNSLKQKVENQAQELKTMREGHNKEKEGYVSKIQKLESRLEQALNELDATREYYRDLGIQDFRSQKCAPGALEKDFTKLLRSSRIKQLVLEYCGVDDLLKLLCLNTRVNTHVLNTSGIVRIIATKFMSDRTQLFKLADIAKIIDTKGRLLTVYSKDNKLVSYVRRFLVHNYDCNEMIVSKIKEELKSFDDAVLALPSVKECRLPSAPDDQDVKELVYSRFRSVFTKFDKSKETREADGTIKEDARTQEANTGPLDKVIGDMYDNVQLHNFKDIQTMNKNMTEEVLGRRLSLILYQSDASSTDTSVFRNNQNSMYAQSISDKPKKYIELHESIVESLKKSNKVDDLAALARIQGQKLCRLLYMMKIVFTESDLLQRVKHLLYSEILHLNHMLNMKETECDTLNNQLSSLSDDMERIKIVENTKNVFYQDNKKLKSNVLDLNEALIVM